MPKFANIAALALAGIAAFGSVPAAAETETVKVSTTGVDLSTAAGQQALHRRIAAASARVCNIGGSHLYASVRRSQRECREATARDAALRAGLSASARIAAR